MQIKTLWVLRSFAVSSKKEVSNYLSCCCCNSTPFLFWSIGENNFIYKNFFVPCKSVHLSVSSVSFSMIFVPLHTRNLHTWYLFQTKLSQKVLKIQLFGSSLYQAHILIFYPRNQERRRNKNDFICSPQQKILFPCL